MEWPQKAALIEKFFAETGPTYDQVVHRFTLGIDRLWKKTMLAKIAASLDAPPRKILDLACGTGILTLALAHQYPESQVVGVDISGGYLAVARRKAEASDVTNVTFLQSRAEDFTSKDRFDAITASYLPKYADIPPLMQNLCRMLAPGGLILFHDFTYPTSRFLQVIFALYFSLIQPIGGGWYPEWREVLRELPVVIQQSDWAAETVAAMRHAGLRDIQVQSLTLQGSALVSAQKAPTTEYF